MPRFTIEYTKGHTGIVGFKSTKRNRFQSINEILSAAGIRVGSQVDVTFKDGKLAITRVEN